ncbi:transcriptional repressor CTCFL-like [Uranotaenia lowii]|uniref:transcriptional repressor CTCFL-like n=1 Tax=Uranotaenia lowii TaxID=190385 RepID=UPI00247ABC27|nr:transcriptional repressor CTCFL-like [Uranotaenia lowii]
MEQVILIDDEELVDQMVLHQQHQQSHTIMHQIPQGQQIVYQLAASPGPSRQSPSVATATVRHTPYQAPHARGQKQRMATAIGKLPPTQQAEPPLHFQYTVPATCTVSNPDNPADINFGSIYVDGQDVYYIQEIEDSAVPEEAKQEPQLVEFQDAVQFAEELQPVSLEHAPQIIYSNADSTAHQEIVPEMETPIIPDMEAPIIAAVGDEQQPNDLLGDDDYFTVEPMELSEVWNDLITANQEILILLELQDLKAHMVDARKIEDQLKNIVCEYCPRVLPDNRSWNRHIEKVHFQTTSFNCDSCSGKFKYYARFRDHLNGHSGKRPYKCDECDHQYAFRIGYLVHKILDHMKLNGIYVCPQCRLDCKDALNYKLHLAEHIDFVPGTVPKVKSKGPEKVETNGISVVSGTAAAGPAADERTQFLTAFQKFSKERGTRPPSFMPGNKKKWTRAEKPY